MAEPVVKAQTAPMRPVARVVLTLGAALLMALALVQIAGAATRSVVTLPVPRATIAAGDVITLSVLESRKFNATSFDRFSVIPNVNDILGKEAVRRLPVGMPIQRSAVRRREIVKRGEPAQLVFQDRGLEIIAHVEPLEDGVAGEIIRVRNVDTGLIVVGRVEENGTISIGP
nr:flagellar basal body P-ring formation chaperone FlgA [uncultured Cohaesibacter sp.]